MKDFLANDYLLKPFEEDRFREALERCRQALVRDRHPARTGEPLYRLAIAAGALRRDLARWVALVAALFELILAVMTAFDWAKLEAGTTVGAVEALQHRALAALRRLLGETQEDGAPRSRAANRRATVEVRKAETKV